MRRGTPNHPKVAQLAKDLGINRAHAIGILESLWHFVSKFAVQGDVGKWSDEAIAEAVFWDDDATKLVQTLAESGWLDASKKYRYVVHDWAQHCDDTTRKNLRNQNLKFVGAFRNDSGKRRNDSGTIPEKNDPPSLAKPRQAKPLKERERATFEKPTLDQVRAYCQERRNSVDPQRFVDHYESNGWKVGSNPMRSWQASVRVWEKRSGEFDRPGGKQSDEVIARPLTREEIRNWRPQPG